MTLVTSPNAAKAGRQISFTGWKTRMAPGRTRRPSHDCNDGRQQVVKTLCFEALGGATLQKGTQIHTLEDRI